MLPIGALAAITDGGAQAHKGAAMTDDKSHSDRLKEAARDLDRDDEAYWAERLRKVAKHRTDEGMGAKP